MLTLLSDSTYVLYSHDHKTQHSSFPLCCPCSIKFLLASKWMLHPCIMGCQLCTNRKSGSLNSNKGTDCIDNRGVSYLGTYGGFQILLEFKNSVLSPFPNVMDWLSLRNQFPRVNFRK